MQQADETTGASRSARVAAASPVVVFLGLMIVLVGVGAAVLLTRDAPTLPPRTPTTTEPDFSLTDAEAIARFKELRALRDQLYRDRDISLLPEIYAPDSPLRSTVSNEIDQLLTDGVVDRSTYKTIGTSVVINTTSMIVIEETVLLSPKFVTEKGKDVTSSQNLLQQRARWTLVEDDGLWLVQRSVIMDSKAKNA